MIKLSLRLSRKILQDYIPNKLNPLFKLINTRLNLITRNTKMGAEV